MLYGRVLPIHVKRLVLRHGQHLLEVGLDCGAVLVVDGVAVADGGALVLPDIRLGHVEPGVWQAGAFRRRRRMLGVIGWYETWRRSTVGRRHVDTSSNTSSWTPGLRGVITKALLLLIHCYLVFLFFTNFWETSLKTHKLTIFRWWLVARQAALAMLIRETTRPGLVMVSPVSLSRMSHYFGCYSHHPSLRPGYTSYGITHTPPLGSQLSLVHPAHHTSSHSHTSDSQNADNLLIQLLHTLLQH